MKYLARTNDGSPLVGDESGFVPLAAAEPEARTMAAALRRAAAGTLAGPAAATAEPTPAEQLTFAIPVTSTDVVLGIGLNYTEHAADLSESPPVEPASFLKPPGSAVGPGGPIRLPPTELTDRVTAEAELAVVFGRTCRGDLGDRVDDVIAGYLPVIDVTAEDVLSENPRFLTRAKGFDSFLVLGPWIAVPDDQAQLDTWTVETTINGSGIARNQIAAMSFPPRELVAFQARHMTFRPGDILTTGTPGAGVIEPGDDVLASVDAIGAVHADVVRAD